METLGALFGNIGLSESATLGWKTEFTNWLFSLGLCQGKLSCMGFISIDEFRLLGNEK